MALSALALVTSATLRAVLNTPALNTPGTPTVAPQGTAGTTSYSYKIVATGTLMSTAAGAAGSTVTGNATLNGTNFNRVTWAAVTNATGYKVYRTVGGATQGLIQTIGSGQTLTLDDTGLTGDGVAAPSTTDESVLEGYIDGVSGLFEQYTGRLLASRTITGEELDGNGRENLWLRVEGKAAYPVTSLTALTLKSSNLSASEVINVLTTVNQVRVDRATGRLTLYPDAAWSSFPVGRKNIVVSFIAGFTSTDHPAQRKTLERLAIAGVQWFQAQSERDPSVSRIDVRADGGVALTYGGNGRSMSGSGIALPDVLTVGLQPFMCHRLA